MSRDLFRAHVVALKAECEALLALMAAEVDLGDPADPAPAACEHPEWMRVPTSTLQGPPSFYCRQCRQEIGA